MKTVYKVLTRHNKQLYSYLKSYEYVGCAFPLQRYFTNKFVKPQHGSKFFAFADLKTALSYDTNKWKKLVVYEAVTTNCIPCNRILPHFIDSEIDFWNFWEKNGFNDNLKVWNGFYSYKAHANSVLCDDLKLVKIINPS